jgi:hypothetical protein
MKKLFLIVCFAALAACSSEPQPVVKPVLELTPRFNLDVLTVTVLDRSVPDIVDSPYSTNNFQPTIAKAIQQSLTQRLIAVGTTGEAIVVIRDASLKSEPIAYTKGSWLDRPQASKYSARAEIELQITGREGQGQVTAQASRYVTLPENPTALERQNAYNTVLNGLMHDLGADMSSAIQTHINRFIVDAPILNNGLPR